MRATDPNHTAMLDRLRNPPEKETTVSLSHLRNIQLLSSLDAKKDHEWVTAPIVVMTNKERQEINAQQSFYFAKINNKPRYIWNIPVETLSDERDEDNELCQDDYNDLYDKNVGLKGFFVEGAPCYLTRNINRSVGLANGTSGILHSIVLDPEENKLDVMDRTVAQESNDIVLLYPPQYVCVRIPEANPLHFVGKTFKESDVVVPIPLMAEEKSTKFYLRNGTIKWLTKRKHPFELKFSLTFHKVRRLSNYLDYK